jgi:hypothetical protein
LGHPTLPKEKQVESGRLATIIVIVVILIGGLGYYENTETVALNNRIDLVQSKAENAETAATEAQAAAREAKAAVASLTTGNEKAGDIGQLVKQATDAAAAASQAAEQAKQAAADVAADRARSPTRRK